MKLGEGTQLSWKQRYYFQKFQVDLRFYLWLRIKKLFSFKWLSGILVASFRAPYPTRTLCFPFLLPSFRGYSTLPPPKEEKNRSRAGFQRQTRPARDVQVKQEDLPDFIGRIRRNYIEGLQWVLRYYYEGCCSWSWSLQLPTKE